MINIREDHLKQRNYINNNNMSRNIKKDHIATRNKKRSQKSKNFVTHKKDKWTRRLTKHPNKIKPVKSSINSFEKQFPQLINTPSKECSIKHIPHMPSHLEYSTIIKSINNNDNDNDNDETNIQNQDNILNTYFTPFFSPAIYKNYRKSVRNQNPRLNTTVTYNKWESTYFQHILDLAEIFSNGIDEINLDVTTNNFDFLDYFGRFIKDSSSGEISPYVEEMNKNTKEFYIEFDIKRNNNII
jgi:hypothetical protein